MYFIDILFGAIEHCRLQMSSAMRSRATVEASIPNDLPVVNATKCQTRHVKYRSSEIF